MQEEVMSSVRLRHIGRTLRELRDKAGMTLKTAERRLDRSASSLSLIEKGRQAIRPRDLKYILDVYEVGPDLHQALMTLAEQERQNGWWSEFKDLLSPPHLDYASLEHDAVSIDITEMAFIPGFLQTKEYAHAVMRSNVAETPPDRADRFLAFRMARQRILYGPEPPRFRAVIDEAALRRPRGGPTVMRAQLHKLLEASEQEHISVQALPFVCADDPGFIGPFMVLNLGQPTSLSAVLLDHLTGRWVLEDDRDIIRYREKFQRMRDAALSETDSRIMIERIISEL